MPCSLEKLCRDEHDVVKGAPDPAGRQKVRERLERLLANVALIERDLGAEASLGRHTLYEDMELGFFVLAHKDPNTSPPHDHGSSWGVYGQADMIQYRRTDGADGAGKAALEELWRPLHTHRAGDRFRVGQRAPRRVRLA